MGDPRARRTRFRRATTALLAATAVSLGASTLGSAAVVGHGLPAGLSRAVSMPPAEVQAPAAPTPLIGTHSAATGAVGADGPTLTPTLRRALQARLAAVRKKYAYPGVSVAIIFPDGSTWAGASGMADIAGKTPVTPATAFAIASVSKTFTSALVMSMVQDGRVDLDASVRSYLPDLKIDPKVTVRQLLDHTSGLRDYFLNPRIDPALLKDTARQWQETDSLSFVGKPYFKPGRGWHYSNTNYLVLGMLAERVGRAPLGEQLRERFLDPLGLTHTYYQPSEQPRGPVAHGYRFATAAKDAVAVDLSDGTGIVPFTSVVTAAAGAGGIAASATDIARWARVALRRGCPVGGDRPDDGGGCHVDGPLSTGDPVRPRGPGRRHRGAPSAGPFRAVARVPLARALSPRFGRHHRRAHQPEPDRPGHRGSRPAQDRAPLVPDLRLHGDPLGAQRPPARARLSLRVTSSGSVDTLPMNEHGPCAQNGIRGVLSDLRTLVHRSGVVPH